MGARQSHPDEADLTSIMHTPANPTFSYKMRGFPGYSLHRLLNVMSKMSKKYICLFFHVREILNVLLQMDNFSKNSDENNLSAKDVAAKMSCFVSFSASQVSALLMTSIFS